MSLTFTPSSHSVVSTRLVQSGRTGLGKTTRGLFLKWLAMASMCLGLMVSALVNTSEKAVPFLVMLVVGQIVLSGGVVPLAGIAGLSQLSWIAPARWGLGAASSTVNVNALTPLTGATDPLWAHTSATWLRDIGFTVALAVLFLIITWIQLRRLGPRQRKARA